ncbi:MAG: MoxR family ATPase [Xenococcaceae cyanobacterium MO_167.B52]|nr:MoxR family ATPase [Xenococcaceae cyanobacterium MO_167.B52]
MTNSTTEQPKWRLFYGKGQKNQQATEILKKLDPPPWRVFGDQSEVILENNNQGKEIDPRWQKLQSLLKNKKKRDIQRGENFRISEDADTIISAVNAAIYLRRPLLVTGHPGSGKTSLAYAIAYELGLGPVLSWPITARSTLQDGLYRYDAIARLQDSNFQPRAKGNSETQPITEEKDIGEYIKLGALGTAFLPSLLPRVLLIDEIDKSDINLPNDLLNLFEEGEFEIPELVRRSKNEEDNDDKSSSFSIYTNDLDIKATIFGGRVRCCAFPIIVMTSNGERDFPPAFKRRCLRVTMPNPNKTTLQKIVEAHFGDKFLENEENKQHFQDLFAQFQSSSQTPERATDQLLNAIYILTREVKVGEDEDSVKKVLLKSLNLEN